MLIFSYSNLNVIGCTQEKTDIFLGKLLVLINIVYLNHRYISNHQLLPFSPICIKDLENNSVIDYFSKLGD